MHSTVKAQELKKIMKSPSSVTRLQQTKVLYNTGYFICLAEQYVLLAEIVIIGKQVNLR